VQSVVNRYHADNDNDEEYKEQQLNHKGRDVGFLIWTCHALKRAGFRRRHWRYAGRIKCA